MKLQQKAVDSVKGRGFYEPENLPVASYDNFACDTFLQNAVDLGTLARKARKAKRAARSHNNDKLALLMAQVFRLVEEVGELSNELLSHDTVAAQVETADVAIVIFQIAEALGCDLETMVIAKLKSDEKRGKLHGEAVEVTA